MKNRELPELLRYLLKQIAWYRFSNTKNHKGFCAFITTLYWFNKINHKEMKLLKDWIKEIETDYPHLILKSAYMEYWFERFDWKSRRKVIKNYLEINKL